MMQTTLFSPSSILQTRLIQKLGDSAFPFCLQFPRSAPNSVLIRGEEGDATPMGVSYEVRLHVADGEGDFRGPKKESVAMSVRKVRKDGHKEGKKVFCGLDKWPYYARALLMFHFSSMLENCTRKTDCLHMACITYILGTLRRGLFTLVRGNVYPGGVESADCCV